VQVCGKGAFCVLGSGRGRGGARGREGSEENVMLGWMNELFECGDEDGREREWIGRVDHSDGRKNGEPEGWWVGWWVGRVVGREERGEEGVKLSKYARN
jgi:hypothetical protein